MPFPPHDDETLPLLPSRPRAAGEEIRRSMRYEVLEEIASGGMGLVLRVRDPDLDRQLALKVLLEEHQGNPEMVQRFLEEARIAGGLQHPGIVPIHDIGRLSDDRPFFTMKLVEGRTLGTLLAERASPADNLQHFLLIFEQVCQTLAYAHSRGVIHRDLKPGNIMVGAFGEVQVMDWGLAQVLAPPHFPAPSQGPTRDEGGSGFFLPPGDVLHRQGEGWGGGGSWPESTSTTSQIVGTPAYMPPEQARGKPLDERADVFGLGGILCEILTSQAPFPHSRSAALWLLDQDLDLVKVHDRLQACGADGELIALAKQCLAEAPADRPANATVVAERLAAYRTSVQERLHRAEVERAAAQASVEAERARARAERRSRRLLAGLSLVGALLISLGSAMGIWWWQQRQATEHRVLALLDQANLWITMAEKHPDGEHTLTHWREAGTSLDQAAQTLENGFGSDALRQRVTERLQLVRRELAQHSRDRHLLDTFAEIRIQKEDEFEQTDTDGRYRAAFQEYGLALQSFTQESVAEQIRKRPQAVVRGIIEALDDWYQERRRLSKPPAQWQPLLILAAALDDDPWRSDLRRRLGQVRSPEPGRKLLGIDTALQLLTRGGLALRLLAAGIETARPRAELMDLAARAPVDRLSATSARLLASALRRECLYAEAIRLLRSAQQRHPGDAWLNHDLAQALHRQPRPQIDEAIRFYTAARAIRPQIGHALAHALEAKGADAEAAVLFGELIRLRPKNANHYNCLALLRQRAGQHKEALALFRQAIAVNDSLDHIWFNLANLLVQMNDFVEAEKVLKEGLRHGARSAACHTLLGFVLQRLQRPGEAENAFRKAIALNTAEAYAHFELARMLTDRGKITEAAELYESALRIQPNLPSALTNLGIIRMRQGRAEEALKHFRRAARLKPDLDLAQAQLGAVLASMGRLREALVPLRKALALNPKNVDAQVDLAVVLANLGQIEESMRLFRQALALEPNNSKTTYNFASVLRQLGQRHRAMALYRQAVAFKPDFAEAHCNLAGCLREEGEFAEALASMRRGHALGMRRVHWPYPSYRWVCECERLAQIESLLPELLFGRRPAADTEERLLAIRICLVKRMHAARVKLIQQALTEDPGLAEHPEGIDRVSAARSALQAAAGNTTDVSDPDERSQQDLREQALLWLGAELERSRPVLKKGNPKAQAAMRGGLSRWLSDADFAVVREPVRMRQLPEGERLQWRQFWRDVHEALGLKGNRDDS